MGNVFGFEEEFAYAKDFFGSAPTLNSSVLTVMSNVMLVPNLGRSPLRSRRRRSDQDQGRADAGQPADEPDNNNFGWDIGGGVIIASQHFGVRGDIRYFHSFQDQTIAGFVLSNSKLNFGRAAVAVMLMF